MAELSPFTELARRPDAGMDVLALALAAEFRTVDAAAALADLDALGGELRALVSAGDGTAAGETRACVELLGGRHGFVGDRERYDDPENSMLDVVLTRRRGLPIVLSVVYVEVARRAGVPLAGVGLPGHYVVGHFGAEPPVVIDPFAGGEPVEVRYPDPLVRPWTPHETAMRMLNNLVGSFQRRGNIGAAIRAAELRVALPAEDALAESLRADLRAMQARLN
jgi:regulator of sirC expression with transglutaminase-like and TPR domain